MTDLEQGRAAVAERRWAEAYERLSRAQARGELDASDHEQLALAAFLRGEGAAAVTALTRAHALWLDADEHEGAARAAGWLALYVFDLGDLARFAEWGSRAVALAARLTAPSAVAGLVQVPMAMAQIGGGDPQGARARLDEIAAIGRRFDDVDVQAFAAFGAGKALIEAGEVDAGLRRLDVAAEAVSGTGVSPAVGGLVLSTVVSDALAAFDLQRAADWVNSYDRWCREQPDLVMFAGHRHALRAALLLTRESWGQAAHAAELGMAGWRAGDVRAAFGAPYWFGEVQRLRGATYTAADAYRHAGDTMWEPQPGSALLHLAHGDVRRATEEIRRTLAGAGAATRRPLLAAMVEIGVAAGDLDAARRAADELEAIDSSSLPMLAAATAQARARVLLAEDAGTAAGDAAAAAEERWLALGNPYEAARSGVLLGRALLSTRPEAARGPFDRARDVFARLGAEPALADLAAAEGRRPPGSLTDRELEVLRLVSKGHTNRRVAAELGLSEKTVARHLSNIFAKLGVSSRAAATSYAYENGLV